jgi:hypothetical protein
VYKQPIQKNVQERVTMKEKPISIGVFPNHEQADRALTALEHAGFDKDRLGYVSPRRTDLTGEVTNETPSPTSIAAGAIGGGAAGGLLGTGAALLIPGVGPVLAGGLFIGTIWGAAIGSVTGGLIGAFISVGVPEDEARYYQGELEKGHTLVTVKGEERAQEAMRILNEHGALDADMRQGRPALHPGTPSSIPPEQRP